MLPEQPMSRVHPALLSLALALICAVSPAVAMTPQACYAGAGYLQGGHYQKAEEELSDCLAQGPLLDEAAAAAHFNRGMARVQLSDFDGAMQDMDSAIEAKPDYGRAWCVRGRLKDEFEGDGAGHADIEKGIDLGASDPFWCAR